MNKEEYNYHDFFELSPDLLIITTLEGYFKEVNQATLNTLGYTKEELFSKPVNSYIHPDDRESTTNKRQRIKFAKTITHFENRYITKKGDTVWLEWTSRVSKKGNLLYSIAKNITYKKSLEIDRNLLISNLKEKNQSYERLTYTTAHDLRSPVDSLLTIFKLIDIPSIKDKQHKKLLEVLEKGSIQLRDKLSEYIDNLSKNKNIKVILENVNFQETLNKVSADINNLIKSSDTIIETDFSKAETILFNEEYLHSILLNLLSNSIKYSKKNTAPHIKISTEKQGDTVKLYFSDNGMGFDTNKVKDRIFGLHQTFHENKDSKGIGLYLVRTHITSFGGDIEVNSEVGKGTTFVLTFNELYG